MSRYLLDTHTLLWFLTNDRRLSARALAMLESHRTVPLVSAACICEIAIKRSLGRLAAPADLLDVLSDRGFGFLSVRPQHAWHLGELPLGVHRDPFDRLLCAQALYEGLPVISNDEELDQYGIERRW